MYNELEKFLSSERLKKYLDLTNDKQKAIDLYELNLKYSSQMYLVLSCFEVILRNTINRLLVDNYNNNWILELSIINNSILEKFKKAKTSRKEDIKKYKMFLNNQISMLETAINSLNEDNKPITNDYLVSRLNFGFWTRLFNRLYEGNLWNKYLYKTFNKPIRRGFVEFRLNELRRLRNRIAHNECILNLKHTPIEYYDFMMEILNMIDSKIVIWLKKQMSRDLFK